MSTNSSLRRLSLIGGVCVTALLASSLPMAASAAPVVYLLTSDHCTGGCGTPPFGSVTLNQNGTTVDVTVDLFGTNAFVKTGSADDQAFKFNATGVALGDITVDQNAPKPLAAQTGAFNGDGTGNFSFGIACPTCGGGNSDMFSTDIIFHVADATIADLTVPNNLGNVFVADIIGSTGNTGPVDATTANPPMKVAEPSSLAVLGGSLVAMGLVLRRRKKAEDKTAEAEVTEAA